MGNTQAFDVPVAGTSNQQGHQDLFFLMTIILLVSVFFLKVHKPLQNNIK